jgi:hypothetical protein
MKQQLNEVKRMQQLAGIPVKSNLNEALSGLMTKVKDKIVSLPIFQKLIDTVVSKMSDKEKAVIKSKFNLSEGQDGPSFDAIMSKVHAANPDKDSQEKINEELDRDSIEGSVVNLIRNLTGINLLALGGAPLGILITKLAGWSWAALPMGILISLIASLIIHGISRKLLGMSGDGALVGDD